MMSLMRIAILHYTKPPVVGGVERVVGEQAAALAAMGHEVSLWSADESSAFRKFLGDGSSPLHGPFLHPRRRIEKHRHLLPHWQQEGVWCFVTWRLADSLPQEFVQEWLAAREAWLRDHPKPWSAGLEVEYHKRFSDGFHERLDRGLGSCILRGPRCAAAVEQVLRFFDGERYTLRSFSIMPNHVHVLVRLRDGWPLEKVVQNWKERSAKAINQVLGTAGTVWQKGYFDRLIRSAEHWEFVDGYIRRNPEAAGLKSGFQVWSADESSAYCQTDRAESHRSVDAVIVHNVFTMPFDLKWTRELIELAKSRREIRWVNWVHDVRWAEEVPAAIHVAVSEHRRADYAKCTSEPIHVIPNGCDSPGVLGLPERVADLHLERHSTVLLHPARLVRRKNIEFGLRVCAELPEATYLVTGAPDPHQVDGVAYHAELKTLVGELDLEERVLFLGEAGALNDDDLRGLYQMADAMLFPSSQEGYGLPLVEAALHGLPIFCSDIPPHREISSEATFFGLGELPAEVARWIAESDRVRERQSRRALMRKLDWQGLLEEHLVPLLQGRMAAGL